MGVYNDPQLNAELMQRDWAYVDDSGNLIESTGRIDKKNTAMASAQNKARLKTMQGKKGTAGQVRSILGGQTTNPIQTGVAVGTAATKTLLGM